jgi:hypothetical protein
MSDPDLVGEFGHVPIRITQLSSGHVHIRGYGPCNWAQPAQWPCSEEQLRKSAFPEASEEFIRAALRASMRGECPDPATPAADR